MWLPSGNLACDTCPAKFDWNIGASQEAVINAARTRGWHLFTGASLTGKDLEQHLCPACVGTNRGSVPKAERLVEDQPLF